MGGWEEVEADIAAVFGFSKEERPQDRAHAYIDRRGISRTATDTAIQCAATDLAARAFEAGRAEGFAAAACGVTPQELEGMARRLMAASVRMEMAAEGMAR